MKIMNIPVGAKIVLMILVGVPFVFERRLRELSSFWGYVVAVGGWTVMWILIISYFYDKKRIDKPK